MSGPIAITSGELTATVSPLGAELLSLTDAAGREYMTDADPRWWTGHAPILFPIVGALEGETYRLGTREYALEKHGFARKSQFVCERHERSGCARFALEDSAATHAVFPFAFRLELNFEIEDRTLSITATVTNRSDASMPFSFGFHPAFAWPLPGGMAKDQHRVVFAKPEPGPVRRIGKGDPVLLPDALTTPVDGDTLVPRARLFEADALIWTELDSRSLRFGADGGAWLELEFPDCPHLGIWQKPGAPFLALEPWHGYNDPAGFDGDFRDKPGNMTLAPRTSARFLLSITVTPPPENTP
ncbi:aldose 1-epimerase family protein [Tsuneonella amylolytica]|uniref:aldose 1-epimerase family protein n=1 Tax=Tsuneonella amylolytica TaxID=2338327 RepID=UPI000EA991C7|nr:aldose 1-epimerase family protein [Tsuneonella amylolytica]